MAFVTTRYSMGFKSFGHTNIGQGAFNGEPIQTVTSEIENPFEIDGSTFAENVYQNATLFVPVGKVDAYRSTPAWNQFLKIREIGSSANPEPYAVLSDNNTVLTFYYDGNKANRNGLDINYTNSWDDQRKNITKAVFDDSFANCFWTSPRFSA